LGVSGSYVLVSLADALDGLAIILPFPFQIRGQDIVQRGDGVLPMALRILLQLLLAFWLDGYCVYASRVGVGARAVKRTWAGIRSVETRFEDPKEGTRGEENLGTRAYRRAG
jgi:hypothetical protein